MVARKEKISSLLKGISESDISKAQKKLNSLCKLHGLRPWKVNSARSNWLELGFLGLGLKIQPTLSKKSGRPSISEDEAANLHIANVEFSVCDENGEPLEKPMSKKASYHQIADELGIEPKMKQNGEFSKPSEIIRGRVQKYNKASRED